MELKFSLEKQIKDLFQNGFKNIDQFLQAFYYGLQIDWTYSNIDYDLLFSPNLSKPQVVYNSILNLLHFHKKYFEQDLPYQADLGLFRLNSIDLKKHLMSKPD